MYIALERRLQVYDLGGNELQEVSRLAVISAKPMKRTSGGTINSKGTGTRYSRRDHARDLALCDDAVHAGEKLGHALTEFAFELNGCSASGAIEPCAEDDVLGRLTLLRRLDGGRDVCISLFSAGLI